MTAAAIKGQAQSQSSTAGSPAWAYDVISVKPAKSPDSSGMMAAKMMLDGRIGVANSPDGITATNVTVATLIQQAFGVRSDQVSGGPDWIRSQQYDVTAKLDPSLVDALAKLNRDDREAARRTMLEKLLEDRFQLKARRETRDQPIYSLVIAKNGPKLQESAPSDDASAKGKQNPSDMQADLMKKAQSASADGGGSMLGARGTTMANFALLLTRRVGRTVEDKTGLTGKYDVKLQYAADPNQSAIARGLMGGEPGQSDGGPRATDTPGPDLFTALQQQLGLKLEPGKGPVEFIVIEHVERPSEN
jgi:uncharacterized protein (TIGR03435 family)